MKSFLYRLLKVLRIVFLIVTFVCIALLMYYELTPSGFEKMLKICHIPLTDKQAWLVLFFGGIIPPWGTHFLIRRFFEKKNTES